MNGSNSTPTSIGFAGAFIRDSAVYGAAGILTRATAILLLPLYTRLLTPGDIGQIELLTIAASLVHVTIALEISQALGRLLPESTLPHERRAFASTAFAFTVGTYLVMALFALLLAPWIAELLFGASTSVGIVRVAALATLAGGLFQILLSELRYELNARAYALVSITFTTIAVGGAVVLVGLLRFGAPGVFLAQALAGAIGTLLALAGTREVQLLGGFDPRRLRQMLAFSLPLVPASVGVIVAMSVDRIAIGQLMTVADVGIFSVGYRIAQGVSLLIVGFQLALAPLIYSRHAEPNTPSDLERVFRGFVGFGLVLCLTIGLFGEVLLGLFATPAYESAAGVIAILAPALLLANMYIFAPGLGIAKRTSTIALLSLGTACLNTVLAFGLIPFWGIYGASVATLISSGLGFAGWMAMSQRLYFVPHRWPRLGSALAASVAALAIGLVVTLPTAIELPIRVSLIAADVALILALGLIRPSEIREIYGRITTLRAA